jgi:hypothetical protein
MPESSSLASAYRSFSESLFDLLMRDDLPRSVRAALIRLACDLRDELTPAQAAQIEAMEVRAMLPACLAALSAAESPDCSK